MTLTGDFRLLFLTMWPIAGSFISYLIGRRNKTARDYFANFLVTLEFAMMIWVAFSADNHHPLTFEWTLFMNARIYLVLDGFRAIYGIITALMWLMTTLFSREYFAHYRNRNRYYLFMLFTLAGTIGVFLSGDLMTTFMFFEMMSFTSYVMVIHDERPGAIDASKTYMAVAVIGGLSMLMGIFIIRNQLHTTEIAGLYEAMHHYEGSKGILYLAGGFMLVGFGGKAGMYPLHIWLPNAHPVAPAPASALLSGVLTKTGIYGILVVSVGLFLHDNTWGLAMLIIGVLGMFTGALLALFSVDLKRTLACSSMSQIGFIMVGVGMQGILGEHNALAVRGTLLHMVNHSLIKLVLFMAAGVVYMNLHELDLNKVRGFGRGKPLLMFCFLMGVLGIIGLPFWNGYVSKTLLHESIVEQIWLFEDYVPMARFYQVVESIFTLTGGLTTAYMIKIFTCVFIEKNQFNPDLMTSKNKRYMNKTSSFALFASALLLPFFGFNFNFFMNTVGGWGQEFMHGHEPAHAVELLAWANLRGAVASLAIGGIIYVFIVRGCMMKKDGQGRSIYVNLWPSKIDLETYVYKPLLQKVLPFIGALFARTIGSIPGWISSLVYKGFMGFRRLWTDNTGKDRAATALADARVAVESNQGPLITGDQLSSWYEQNAARVSVASEVVWEGEGDLIREVEILSKNSYEAAIEEADQAAARLPHDEHGHDDHHEEHHEAPKGEGWFKRQRTKLRNRISRGKKPAPVLEFKTAEGETGTMQPESLYDWFVYYCQRFAMLFRRTDEEKAERQRKRYYKNDLARTVFNSLAYSLLLFLVGFVVLILFVF